MGTTFNRIIPELRQIIDLLDAADIKSADLVNSLKYLADATVNPLFINDLISALSELKKELSQVENVDIKVSNIDKVIELLNILKSLGEFNIDLEKPIGDSIPGLRKIVESLKDADAYAKALAMELESFMQIQATPPALRVTLDYLKQIQKYLNSTKESQIAETSPKQVLEKVSNVESIDKEVQSEADFEDVGKILGRRLVEGMLAEVEKEFPGITERLNELFGENINKVTKLQSGVFKISGEIDGSSSVRYIDRLGNIHENLRTASKLTRQELETLEKEFPQLAEAAKRYGFEIDNIVKAERRLGDGVVKLRIETDEGGMNLFVDNLGRVATSIRDLKKQLSSNFLEQLQQQFAGLNDYLQRFGATLRDIVNVSKRGNVTEISFMGVDEKGVDTLNRVYGDAQGRLVQSFAEASQLTAEQVAQVAKEYEAAFQEASKYGGSVENLINVTKDESSGIVGLTFALQDAIEGVKQLTFWTDKAGRVSLNKRDLGEIGFSPEQLDGIRKRFAQLEEHINKYGFEMKHLKSAHTEVSTGITRLNFVMKTSDGIIRTLNVAIDKHGNILRDVQRKYQGFIDGVVRNTIEAAKWMVAIQLTYVPLEKFNELIQLSIDNQDKLADSAIALNMSMAHMGRTFNSITQVANSTGTPLNEALQGFSSAYRATAGLGSQAQRTAVALDLLKNSLILSRLATIDQKEAMDVLISSLRQMGMPLSQSQQLLDKWIATSKNSQVSIQDLAEAYSVVGAAAKSSGFDMDTLNGVIAALAESTSYSGKQIGNIIRSFISNMSSDTAQQALEGVGIAVKDLNGNLRSSLEVLAEISSRYSAGLINDTQLTELARALAGGSRRAAPMITLIKTYGKALEMAKISSKATAESQEALNIKLETARSKVTQLSNAFQHLANTFGTDGGVLDVFGLLTDSLRIVVNLMDELVARGGRSVTLFTTLLPLLSYFSKTGRLDSIATWFSGKVFGMEKVTTETGEEVLQPRKSISSGMLVHGIMSAMLIGGAIADALQGDTAKAAYDFAGQTIGTAAGAVLGGSQGALIGQFIGSAIGHWVYKNLMDTGEDVGQVMAEVFMESVRKKSDTGLKKDLKREQDEVLGGTFLNFLANTIQEIAPIADTLGLMSHDLAKAYEKSPQLTVAAGAVHNPFISQEFREKLQKLLDDAVAQSITLTSANETISNPIRYVDYEARDVKTKHLQELSRITLKLTDETKKLYESGKISAAEYGKRIEDINKLMARLSYAHVAAGDAIVSSLGGSSQAFEGWAKILIEGSKEEKENFTEIVDAINTLSEKIKEGKGDTEEYKKEIEDLRYKLLQFTKETDKAITIRNFKKPNIIDLGEGLSDADVQKIEQRAQRLTEAYGRALVKAGVMTKEAFEEWLSLLDDVYVKTAEDTIKTIPRVLPQFVSQAKRELEKEGEISTTSTGSQFQIRQLNFSSARRGEFMAALEWAKQFLQTNFPQYKLKEQEMGVIYKDQKTDVIHADLLQLLLATNKLVEINQKQLDGIYNLPSGATFWVPWQAWNMQFAAGGSAGGSFSATRNTKEVEKVVEKPSVEKPSKEIEKNGVEKSRVGAVPNIREKLTPLDITKLPIEPQDERYKFYHSPPSSTTIFTKSMKDILSEEQQWLKSQSRPITNFLLDIIQGLFGNNTSGFGGVLPKLQLQQQNNSPSALQFNLELNHKVALSLDGEVIATAVSRYIGEELLSTARGMAIHKSIEVM